MMRALLERLTGRYRFQFRADRAGTLVAHPTKDVRVELSRGKDRWYVELSDEAGEAEESPNAIVFTQPLAPGLSDSEAQDAAAELALDYLRTRNG